MADESESTTRLSFAVVAHVPNRIMGGWIFEVVGERVNPRLNRRRTLRFRYSGSKGISRLEGTNSRITEVPIEVSLPLCITMLSLL